MGFVQKIDIRMLQHNSSYKLTKTSLFLQLMCENREYIGSRTLEEKICKFELLVQMPNMLL
jgi:hypothetical protein